MMILLFLISGAFAGALFRTIKEVMNLKKEIRLLHSAVEEHDLLISQNIDHTIENFSRISDIEKHIGIDINVCDGCLVDDCQGCPYIEKSIVTMDRNEKNIEG